MGFITILLTSFYMTELIKLLEVENALSILSFILSLKQIIKENHPRLSSYSFAFILCSQAFTEHPRLSLPLRETYKVV